MKSRTTMTYAAALATAATLALAGCSGSDKNPTPTATPSSSTTTSPSPSVSTSPTTTPSASASIDVPAAAREDTDKGATAFVRYWFEQLNIAYTKPDVTIIPALSTPECKSCAALQESPVEFAKMGQRMASAPVAPLTEVAISPSSPTGQKWVTFTLKQLPVPVLDKSGKETDRQEAKSGRKIASVLWKGGQWKLHGIANEQ